MHYYNYRSDSLRSIGRTESILACDEAYESRIQNTKQTLAQEMFLKEEEIRQKFVTKVREKELALREREEQVG